MTESGFVGELPVETENVVPALKIYFAGFVILPLLSH